MPIPEEQERVVVPETAPSWARVAELKFHPRNYRKHPADQIAHLMQSIRVNGFYRNVVVSRDDTILAGAGTVTAARKLGMERVPVVRLPIEANDPRALKVIAGDNEIGRLAEVDDRALTDMLMEIMGTEPEGLLGTGFDKMQLASLLYVTRPATELADIDAAAEWVGMPEYVDGQEQYRVVITCVSEEDRDRFVAEFGLTIDKRLGRTWSTRWPFTVREDVAAVRFQSGDDGHAE